MHYSYLTKKTPRKYFFYAKYKESPFTHLIEINWYFPSFFSPLIDMYNFYRDTYIITKVSSKKLLYMFFKKKAVKWHEIIMKTPFIGFIC